MEYVKIKNVVIEKTAVLAPMAGVSDYAFRIVAKNFGAAFVTGEMASAKGLCYNDKKTAALLSVTARERPMAVQLFGSEAEYFTEAIETVMRYNPDVIDINAGCPVPKVAGNGAGAALMKDIRLIEKIVSAAVKKSADIPITIKIRSGWDEKSINAVEAAKAAEAGGASAITVHARTKNQFYSGNADRSVIKDVKRAVSIPVIGNGDIFDAEDCASMYNETGCDLVMVGRGACGRPWLFTEIKHFLETGEKLPPPDIEQRIEIMKNHIELLVKDKGEYSGMREARKLVGWYLKGLKNAASYRLICGRLTKTEDFYTLISRVRNENF